MKKMYPQVNQYRKFEINGGSWGILWDFVATCQIALEERKLERKLSLSPSQYKRTLHEVLIDLTKHRQSGHVMIMLTNLRKHMPNHCPVI